LPGVFSRLMYAVPFCSGAGWKPFKLWEFNERIRSEPKSAVVFELYLCHAGARPKLAVLHNGQVRHGILESTARLPIELDVAFHLAEANDSHL
jgi:hypothetical protein